MEVEKKKKGGKEKGSKGKEVSKDVGKGKEVGKGKVVGKGREVGKGKDGGKGKDVGKGEKVGNGKEGGTVEVVKKVKKPVKVVKKKEEDFYADIDMPPSESEEEYERAEVEKNEEILHGQGKEIRAKDLKKAKKVEQQQAMASDLARREAYADDTEVFSVSIAGGAEISKTSAADANARDIKIEGFSVSAKGKELFNNTSLTIAYGRRYGLVGPNGMGKSTVMKLIARRMLPVPDNLDVLLVEQEVIGDERSAIEAVMQADEELTNLKAEEMKLLGVAEENDEENGGLESEDDSGLRLKEIHERIEELGGSTAESRASKILSGLGFTAAMQTRPTVSFSGGWRMRISLARALFMLPSVLLLDEPTNHLDLRAVLWLEEYLQRWKKTLVVVSHDRDFLNTVSTDIIHLHDMKLWQYKGNFDSFEKMYEQRRREQNKLYDKYVSDMRKAKTSKAAQDKAKDKAKMDRERRAKRSGKKKNELEDDDVNQKADPISKWADYSVNFAFPEPTELGHPLLQLIDCEFQYPGREDFKLEQVNVGIGMGTRAAIVGPNGAGKSTFLNLLAGELEPSAGEFRRKPKLRVGRYSQHFVDVLNMEVNPVQYLQQLHPEEFAGSKGQQQLRGKLGRFGLSGQHHLTPIAKLSGGQKARVVFTMIALMHPHVLLLDEPTNNLDMESIDALGDAVSDFDGGVVIISHDSRLISRVCEDELSAQLWVVEDGTVSIYKGTFEDYRDETIKQIIEDLDE